MCPKLISGAKFFKIFLFIACNASHWEVLRAKTGEDFSRDFFEDAVNGKNYNEDLDAFKVDDVDYLVDYAKSYLDGTNRDVDYPEDYDPEKPEYDLVYSVEER
ncbi:MAG: hypothetical protein MR515_07530 [Acidaminococcus fermentans]|nr:hypothetical protein [Acidaminococcus fermentans]